MVILLLEQEDIDINISDDFGQTALHEAASHDENSECLALLLTRPDLSTVNPRDEHEETPLSAAVKSNALKCVQLLISDNRTDPNIRDNRGNSPLMFAVKRNFRFEDCAKLLLADPRVDLMTRDNYKRSRGEVNR